MSVSGPSPLGTLMVQRVEAAMGVTLSQQANVATGARPDAVTQPGQPDKIDPAKNPPPKEGENQRRAEGQAGRQGGLAALARNDPELAKLLAARNAPMTGYTASAPTTLGQAAKTILALLQQFPDARPAVSGRAPLLGQAPGQGGGATGAGTQGTAAMAGSNAPAAAPVGGNLDPRAIEALMQRAANGGSAQTAAHAAGRGAPSTTTGQTQGAPSANQPGATLPGAPASGPTLGGIPLPSGMAGQLAMALSQAMQSSGLFYESHLREFAFGRRSLTQMHNEPQAQAGQAGARSGAAEAAQPRAGAESTTTQSGQTSQAHSSSSQQAGQQGAQLSGALLGLDPSTHVLVRQQLETLANQSFAWQGEAWPGSDLEWDVRRREPQGQEETESWATQLKLTLPGLGEVRARLSLADTQLVMHLQAPDGAEVMADHTGLLRERLGLHGLQLSQFSISRDAADEGGPAT